MKTWKLLLALPIIFCLCFAGSIQQYQAQIIKMKKSSCSTGTEWLIPDADTAQEDWGDGNSGGDHSGACDECTSGTTSCADTTTSYIYGGTSNGVEYIDEWTVTNTSSMGAGCSAATITVYVNGRDVVSWPSPVNIDICTGASCEGWGSNITLNAAWDADTWQNTAFSPNWTKAEVDAMTVKIKNTGNASSNTTYISTVAIKIDYQ